MPASDTDLSGVSVERATRPGPSADDIDRWFDEHGLQASRWSNGAGDRYGWHAHPYHKVLVCQRGSIVFHVRDGEIELAAGDTLEIAPETEHAATVGPDGVVCVEASR